MDNQLTVLQQKSSKINIFLSFFLMMDSIFGLIAKDSQFGVAGVIGTALFFALDVFLCTPFYFKRKKGWVALRAIELIAFSVCYVIVTDMFPIAFLALALVLLYFQMMFSCDYNDIFTRVMVLAMSVAPSVIAMVISLLMLFSDTRQAFGKVCVLFGVCILVITLGNVAIADTNRLEEKLFEQRRMADNAKEINEALKIHQEKLKKVNEEVGVQKIKLESAYNRINSANAEMVLQHEILKQTSSIMDVEQLLTVMTNILKENLSLSCCAVLLDKEATEEDEPMCAISSYYSEETEAGMKKLMCEGCLESYIDQENVYIDNHVRAEKYSFLAGCDVGSMLILPMVREQKVEGVLVVCHQRFDFFAENKVFFSTVVAQFMTSLDNARLYTRIEQMAIRDGLTGIYNRRHLNLMMEQFSMRAEQEGTPLSVALFDIDHFKNINDTYGHLFGDLVIKTVAGFANQMSKKYHGFAARYGGEEFVLAFEGKAVEECCAIVEEMRAAIKGMELQYEGIMVKVNVSVGVTAYPQCCTNRNGLLEHADVAMYYSKKHGRDRVTVDSPEIRGALGMKKEDK